MDKPTNQRTDPLIKIRHARTHPEKDEKKKETTMVLRLFDTELE